MIISSILLSRRILAILLEDELSKLILKFKHLEDKVGKIFLLLFIKIKNIFLDGSSNVLSNAFMALIFKNSILSTVR